MKDTIRQYILSNLLFTDDESALEDSESFLDSGIILKKSVELKVII